MPEGELNRLLALRKEAQQLLERLRERSDHTEMQLARYVAAMLVQELDERVAEIAGPAAGGSKPN